MITLMQKDGGAFLGTIEDDDLQMLLDQLEEEDSNDTDYFIGPETIDFLEQRGASPGLILVLKQAVGDSEGLEIAWMMA